MQDQMQPDMQPDNEGAVAKADLYKLANYSFKLFKKINPEDQLEAWVQAKITKAADYIASVYHYLEYEMEFSDYGHKLDNSDVLSEGQKAEMKEKLNEAKEKIKALKKKQADKLAGKVEEGQEDLKKTGDSYKTSKGGTVTKTSSGVKHERDPNSYDDGGDDLDTIAKSGKGTKSHAKSMSAAEKKDRAPALKKSKSGTWGMEGGEKFDNRKEKAVAEGKSKKAKKDYDKDGKVESEKDEVIGSRRKAAGLDEAAATSKKEVAKKDKKETKKDTASTMWKKVKESVKTKKEKADCEVEEATSAVFPSRNTDAVTQQPADTMSPEKKDAIAKAKRQSAIFPSRGKEMMDKANAMPESINESTEVNRIKALTQRLNG